MTSPRPRPRPGRNTFESANTIYNIGRILALLETGPKTYKQVCDALFMTDRNARHYFKHLRAAPNRRVYLKAYIPIPNGYNAQFALGSKPDATKKVQSERERNAKYRAKVKADPDRAERRQRMDAARWAIKKAIRAPHGWAAALGAP